MPRMVRLGGINMAAKGTLAKENLIKMMAGALPAGTYIGEFDKKYYFWSEENGEKVQIAIAMTCPKNPVGEVSIPTSGGIAFSAAAPTVIAPVTHEPAEISEEEKANIADLMAKLGL